MEKAQWLFHLDRAEWVTDALVLRNAVMVVRDLGAALPGP
jgi:hypothetical protein